MITSHVNVIPRVAITPNIRTGNLKELDYDVAHLVATPYAGGFVYLVRDEFLKAGVANGGGYKCDFL